MTVISQNAEENEEIKSEADRNQPDCNEKRAETGLHGT
jgi:hypothetical protein